MKKLTFLLLILIALPSFGQSMEDTLAIKKATLDYIEGWATGNVERIQNSVSPELSKRRVAAAGEMVFVQDMSRSLLCASAMGNAKGVRMPDLTPGKELAPEIRILDIDGSNASIKTWNTKFGFFDYIHLSKAGGKWMIVNVLWDMNAKK
ncbi:MAG: nuclear transport factor 2 family protein [Bacteroidales bacterium]|nr:nuclear transport factor 2 family protein [Bacteroidales bacterium]